MKIKVIKSQIRRDFIAVFECENCGAECILSGYDDKYFHHNVIPNIKCSICNEKAPDSYRPLETKYPENKVI